MVKNNKILFFIILITLLSGCDFTPPLNKQILKAQQFITAQKYKDAIDKYKEILEKNPSPLIQVKINYQLGDLYSIYLSENETSIKYYQNVMKITNDPLWLVKTEERIGEIYFSYLKDYKNSLKVYKKLSQFEPRLLKQDFYQFRYALSGLNANRLEEARKIFEEISKDKTNKYYIRSKYFIGLVEFQLKNWDKALDAWRQYLKSEKRRDNIVQTKFLIANVYETTEKLKKAYDLYYSILGEYPNTEVVKNRLKGIYERRIARKR